MNNFFNTLLRWVNDYKEDKANKTTSISSTPSDQKYPSEKAVVDYVSEHGCGDYEEYTDQDIDTLFEDLTGTIWSIQFIPTTTLLYEEFDIIGDITGGAYSLQISGKLAITSTADTESIIRDSVNEYPRFVVKESGVFYQDGTESYTIDKFTLHISGGNDDVSNPDLITWLKANATPIVTDLTDTTWQFKNSVAGLTQDKNFVVECTFTSGAHTYSLPFTYSTYTYTQIEITDSTFTGGTYGGGSTGTYEMLFRYNNDDGWFRASRPFNYSETSKVAIDAPTIHFTGGTDITNPDLISWMINNATLLLEGD